MTKIKKGNEFIEVHSNENGTFLLFGAETEAKKAGNIGFFTPAIPAKRFAYEMNLSEEDKLKLIEALNGKATV